MEYSGVILVGKYTVSKDVATASTNGVDVRYGEAFIAKLTDAELRALVLHENLHKAFMHMFLWKHLYEINGKRANMACDYVINLIIYDIDRASNGFVTLPEGGLLDTKYRDMDSQQVFDALTEDDEEEGEGEGEGEGGDDAGLDEHDWDTGDMTPEDIQEVQREIDQAIRQGQMLAGKMNGNQSAVLGALTTPKVDWRVQLREYLSSLAAGKDISTWQKVNRRWLQHDVYMPSTVSETMGRVVLGADTSGSCFYALEPFLAEMQAICMTLQPDMVDVVYWDTAVARHEVYGRDDLEKMSKSTCPAGGGGTDAACVPKYLKKEQIVPECVVMFTDGEMGSWGEWSCPVLWCVVGNKNAKPPSGVVIHID
jgi:predicted metal-dependent peptidase